MTNLSKFIDFVIKKREVLLFGPLPLERDWDQNLYALLAIDGGILHLTKRQVNAPHLSLGDGDSAQTKLDLMHPTQKNQTDLELGLEFLPQEVEIIYADGLIGGRLDHQLAVLGAFHRWLKRDKAARVEIGHRLLGFPAGEHQISLEACSFSLFCLEEVEMDLSGSCQYQLLTKVRLSPLSGHTLSNMALGGIIRLSTDKPLFIFIVP